MRNFPTVLSIEISSVSSVTSDGSVFSDALGSHHWHALGSGITGVTENTSTLASLETLASAESL